MAKGRCKLLAVDVDGTLLHQGRIDPADADALRAAAKAGLVVCLCTGRAWLEVEPIWQSLRLPSPHGPVICVGGALVAEPDTGRTLYSRPFDRPTAAELASAMRRAGYPVMALVDAWREGFDYFLIGQYDDRELYRRFLHERDRPLRVRQVERLERHIGPRVLRISVLDERVPADALVRRLRAEFAGRIEVQRIHLLHHDVHIVEAFAAGADKFTALVYVGQGCRIGPGSFAAIGDEHNDVAMLRGAGISAAPADAPPEVLAAADIHVGPRGAAPVAQFVDIVLGGQPRPQGQQRAGR